VEKIAINAVMAGALPTYMPFLIAGVEAAMDPASDFGTFGVSTGSFAPCWIINGPARKDIHVNSGVGMLSPGRMANATIGRAMHLIFKNLGGARVGVEDMGQLGNPGKYTTVIAENEEESPWEPLHVEQGFNKEDNAITLFLPQCYVQVWAYGSDDKGILNGVIYNIPPSKIGMLCIVLTHSHAKRLAAKGWTKKEVKTFVSEYARVPAYRTLHYHRIIVGKPAKEFLPYNPDDSMSLIRDPSGIKIVVGGGAGNFTGLHVGERFTGIGQDWVTKKVELPANWDSLVKKYKNLVPTYVRY
jgi:hypothetical protein